MQIAQELKLPLPVARTRNLIVKELPDETLIYDLDSDEAHCLNQTSALVWKNCDGEKSVLQIRKLLEQDLRTQVPEEMVWLAIEQLHKFNLITQVPSRPAHLAGFKRRDLLRKVGTAALTLPLIFSIVSPTPAQQASGCHNQACMSDLECCTSDPVCKNGTCKKN